MTYPMPTGWVPRRVLNAAPVPGTTNSYQVPTADDFGARINEYRQQQMMSGAQDVIPEYDGGDPKTYLQLLAASHGSQVASGFAGGYDLPTIMREASDAGMYEGDPMGGVLGKALGFVGENIEPITAAAFLAPLALGAAGGAFAGGGAGGVGSYTGGGGAGTYVSGSADLGSLISGGMGPQAVIASGAGAGGGAAGAIMNNLPAILSGASSLIGGKLASDSADDAVDAMTQANSEALGFQRESRDIALGLIEPERQAANAAMARMLQMQGLPIPKSLQDALDASGTTIEDFDVSETPGYQFRLKESMDALEGMAFARGGGMSGGFAQSALRYAQDYASGEYDKIYQQLSTLAGRNTSGGGAEVALNFGSNSGRIAMDTGEGRASGYVAQGNAWQNALDQVAELPWDQWFPSRNRQGAMAYGS